MKVLVTGAAGFIGWHVASNLLERGIEVVGFDKHPTTRHPGYQGDILDAEQVYNSMRGVDGVIHLAGVLGTGETVAAPRSTVEANIGGSLNVFEAVREWDIPCSYITVGNGWMYNPYSISKTATESLAWMYNKEHGTKIAVTRVLSAYGPRQKLGPVKKIIPTFIHAALNDRPLCIYGDGEQVCDLIHVADVADILVRALVEPHNQYVSPPSRSEPNPMRFDAGTGIGWTVNEVAEVVLAEVGKPMDDTTIHYVPMRPGEPEGAFVVGDPETLTPLYSGDDAELTSFATGLKETFEWYRSQ